MVRTDWMWTVRIIALAIVLGSGLVIGTGCSESAVTSPSAAEYVRLWIDDGPDKPMTTIRISVSETMWISLTVRDAEGGQVRQLHEGIIAAGAYEFPWDARDDAGESVASGPYWALLTDGDRLLVQAMMLVK